MNIRFPNIEGEKNTHTKIKIKNKNKIKKTHIQKDIVFLKFSINALKYNNNELYPAYNTQK